jgi:hypothetical protein
MHPNDPRLQYEDLSCVWWTPAFTSARCFNANSRDRTGGRLLGAGGVTRRRLYNYDEPEWRGGGTGRTLEDMFLQPNRAKPRTTRFIR